MKSKSRQWVLRTMVFTATLPSVAMAEAELPGRCTEASTVTADVVAIDQPLMFNRMGAGKPNAMMFALRRDVVSTDPNVKYTKDQAGLAPGKVMLRGGKRARPLVLRVNEGDCLRIKFQNLLWAPQPPASLPVASPYPKVTSDGVPLMPGLTVWTGDAGVASYPPTIAEYTAQVNNDQAIQSGVHVAGLDLENNIGDDASQVGANHNSLVASGKTRTYVYFAAHEGTYLLSSTADVFNLVAPVGGQLTNGLFGAVHVEPKRSEWYRSQVSGEEFKLASTANPNSSGYPIINYGATYGADVARDDGTTAWQGTPILRMINPATREIIYSDLTAVVTGPGAGLLSAPNPPGNQYTYPNPTQPYREFTTIYHEVQDAVQSFPAFTDGTQIKAQGIQNNWSTVLGTANDSFAINYGIGGIAAEVWANRIGKGPAAHCPECKFEEFFLSSWVGGDPAMLVDNPANSQPAAAATRAFYPDDPSNVYHSYLNDHVRFRVLHGGSNNHHVHHLHAHQWLYSDRNDKSAYLDSQAIGPGSTYTTDIAYGGSGNKNLTVGDSIFHCHFYPHFAAGMWALWRSHDVLETGTTLSNGIPVAGARALPDGEIAAGTPIPGILPIPGIAMAPLPARVALKVPYPAKPLGPGNEVQVEVLDPDKNPGYPFFIPGVAGHRPPHPPLDFAKLCIPGKKGELCKAEDKNRNLPCVRDKACWKELDGGLPRHIIVGGATTQATATGPTPVNFEKVLTWVDAKAIPEDGTQIEKTAMKFHANASGWPTAKPDGTGGTFAVNGHGPQSGAPFADPCPNGAIPQIYRAAGFQTDAVFNKWGEHFNQERVLALWEDVKDMRAGTKALEPLFFRANSGACIEFWHANLIPSNYNLDAFQVKTPTDIIGQHIHLVKFDVTSSDGAANGWNYEDGTFSPEEVVERINAINKPPKEGQATGGGISTGGKRVLLTAERPFFDFGADKGGDYKGAQATIQRWWADPVLDEQGNDRTLRTVFTHDHFGPSTHQQAGLYGGLLVEPANSTWTMSETGAAMGGRPICGQEINPLTGKPLGCNTTNQTDSDGGPTSFAAYVTVTKPTKDFPASFREFALEFQDSELACLKGKDCGALEPQGAVHAPPDAPDLISLRSVGSHSVNYRAEPLSPRITSTSNSQTSDYSFVFDSISRGSTNDVAQPLPLTGGVSPCDPWTPLLRAYEGENVQVRTLVGAHLFAHNFNIHGVRWFFEPSDPNSGYRNSAAMGLSEHFEMQFKLPFTTPANGGASFADYLYNPDATVTGNNTPLPNGLWGILRAYRGTTPTTSSGGCAPTTAAPYLAFPWLPASQTPPARPAAAEIAKVCPDDARKVALDVTAFTAASIAGPQGTVYHKGPPSPITISVTAVSGTTITFDYATGNVSLRAQAADTSTNAGVFDPVGVRTPVFFNTGCLDPDAAAGTTCAYAAGDKFVVNTDGSTTYTGGNKAPALLATGYSDQGGLVYVESTGWTNKTDPKSAPRPLEPLVLRVNAGDCVTLTLHNAMDAKNAVFAAASSSVGLHPQLVSFDVTQSNGINVGFNPTTAAAAPGSFTPYTWYAGTTEFQNGKLVGHPVEFGTTNLLTSDPVNQHQHGLAGALIVEPRGYTIIPDQNTRASATLVPGNTAGIGAKPFREQVVMMFDDLIALDPNVGNFAFNYGAGESMVYRYGEAAVPGTPAFDIDYSCFMSSHLAQVFSKTDASGKNIFVPAEPIGDPSTPVFAAAAGMPARIRVLHPGGNTQAVVVLHGHSWQAEPYTPSLPLLAAAANTAVPASVGSGSIGFNSTSFYMGSRMGVGRSDHFDMILPSAGGARAIPGDYVLHDFVAGSLPYGPWGLMRVAPAQSDAAVVSKYFDGVISGNVSVYPVYPSAKASCTTGKFASGVMLYPGATMDAVTHAYTCTGKPLNAGKPIAVAADGTWSYTPTRKELIPMPCVVSACGGVATWDVHDSLACLPDGHTFRAHALPSLQDLRKSNGNDRQFQVRLKQLRMRLK